MPLHYPLKVPGPASRQAVQTAENGIGSLQITDGKEVFWRLKKALKLSAKRINQIGAAHSLLSCSKLDFGES